MHPFLLRMFTPGEDCSDCGCFSFVSLLRRVCIAKFQKGGDGTRFCHCEKSEGRTKRNVLCVVKDTHNAADAGVLMIA